MVEGLKSFWVRQYDCLRSYRTEDKCIIGPDIDVTAVHTGLRSLQYHFNPPRAACLDCMFKTKCRSIAGRIRIEWLREHMDQIETGQVGMGNVNFFHCEWNFLMIGKVDPQMDRLIPNGLPVHIDPYKKVGGGFVFIHRNLALLRLNIDRFVTDCGRKLSPGRFRKRGGKQKNANQATMKEICHYSIPPTEKMIKYPFQE